MLNIIRHIRNIKQIRNFSIESTITGEKIVECENKEEMLENEEKIKT